MKLITALKLMWLWPPYLGAGIRVMEVNDDLTHIKVKLAFRFWNINYVRTQFGGSLYSMVDPFYMLMFMENLGRDYIVWDKASTIRFKKPGKGPVYASFDLTREKIEEVRRMADQEPKVEPVFQVHIVDEAGEVVAEVDKTLYVKRKDKARKAS